MKDMYGKNTVGVVFKTYNGLLVNSLEDVAVNQHLGFNGAYDKKKVTFLLSLVEDDSCVYIIGAHIGTLAIPVAGKAKSVIAFEANPATFEFLSWNAQLNLLHNTTVYNYAIFNEEKELSFYQNKANTGGSKIKPSTDHFWYNYDQPETITVCGKILDNFVRDKGHDFPSLIIMDIEGAEYAALKGASECLRHCRYLYIEFMPHHLSNVAGITIDKFVKAITDFFPNMIIVDEYVQDSPEHYTGDEILEKLTQYFNRNRGVDLLFSKERL